MNIIKMMVLYLLCNATYMMEALQMRSARWDHAAVCMPVHTSVNRNFIIKLPAQKSAGYSWSIIKLPHMLELVKQEYIHPESSLLGGQGTQLFTFKARNPGQTTIQFKYARPWMKHSERIKQRCYTITVS